MNNLKTKIGIIAVAVLLATLIILAGIKENVGVQQAYGMTITNQQLAQVHSLSDFRTLDIPYAVIANPSPYTSSTIR
jgi:hypothetical protein